MDAETFEHHLRSRGDGYWELLSTAAGAAESISRTTAGLTAATFRAGVGGAGGTPSLVQDRVEALAAYGKQVLIELSRDWPRPRVLSNDSKKGENDLLFGAWRSAFRFLVSQNAITYDDVATDLVGLQEESDICFGIRSPKIDSWDDLVDGVATGRIGYAKLRALDKRELPVPTIDAKCLMDLMTRGRSGAPELKRLRVLRGREDRLAADAVQCVCDTLTEAARDPAQLSELGVCVAAELAIGHSHEVRFKLMDAVADELRVRGQPRNLAPLIYVLLQRGWSVW